MEKVMKKIQLKIVTKNSYGLLAEVTGLVADKGVNIEDLCAYANGDEATLYVLTNDNSKAREVLEEKGFHVEETEVIILRLWNRPGSLSSVATKFRQHAINLNYVYGTSSLGGERMTFVFSAEDNVKAAEIFDEMVIEEAYVTA
jgi:ACT domain-containing protein